ncbi:hypothetical protein C8J27_10522 [Rhodobacter aestuarii]|uniref:Uncharacterized protein n=1 Tax=Rhodobacter aestuarii TaxID=453582 RepID=A0A1N7LRE9_9RHOB|nr:hypothetical protein [Rhodobacter aestuarii]PTV95080.1 hypothetical protein C8J27_10522 [Rhodobacter aestuarii]SIS76362.1 hypothetical protein SAMN05421580_104254 [Rhodobacter aestuarii]
MWGPLLSFAGMASLRTALGFFGVGLWLMSRPGGWAVVVAAILVGVKLLPGGDDATAAIPPAIPFDLPANAPADISKP